MAEGPQTLCLGFSGDQFHTEALSEPSLSTLEVICHSRDLKGCRSCVSGNGDRDQICNAQYHSMFYRKPPGGVRSSLLPRCPELPSQPLSLCLSEHLYLDRERCVLSGGLLCNLFFEDFQESKNEVLWRASTGGTSGRQGRAGQLETTGAAREIHSFSSW